METTLPELKDNAMQKLLTSMGLLYSSLTIVVILFTPIFSTFCHEKRRKHHE